MKKEQIMRFVLAVAVGLCSLVIVIGQQPKKPVTITAKAPIAAVKVIAATSPTPSPRVKAFNEAWSAIDLEYFDRTFGGLDWNKVKAEFQPRVDAAKTDAEIDELILEMAGRLGKSHFGIIPATYFRDIKKLRQTSAAREHAKDPKPDKQAADGDNSDDDYDDESFTIGRYGVGIELRRIDGQFIVAAVQPGSSAADGGVRPGYVIDKINDISLQEIAERIRSASPHVHHLDRLLPTAIKSWILDRDYALNIKITCIDENNVSKEFDLPRRPLAGDIVGFGNGLPEQFLEYRSASLNDDVGYIKFNVFAMRVLGKLCDSLAEFRDKKTLILDMRGNAGGLIYAMRGIAGMLEPKEISLGKNITRDTTINVSTEDKRKKHNGKLIILVDDQSISAAEILTAALQDNGRAIVIGQRTAGDALPAMGRRLSTGSIFFMPVANYLRPIGDTVEGAGVQPDIEVTPNRRSLLEDTDPVLKKALSIANSETYDQLLALHKLPKTLKGKHSDGIDRNSSTFAVTGNALPPPRAKVSPGPGSGKLSAIPGITEGSANTSNSNKKDPKALAVITTAAKLVGDLDSIKSYSADGNIFIKLGDQSGSMKYNFSRERPNKYAVTLISDIVGVTRTVGVGDDTFFESSAGLPDQKVPAGTSPQAELLGPLFDIFSPDYFRSVSYDGEFDSDGRKLMVIDGVDKNGMTVAITFDSKTGLPFRITARSFEVSFDRYRQTGSFMLPRSVSMSGLVDILITTFKVNEELDPTVFERKENCFDKP